MSEPESTALAVREVYSAYYSEMGGVGAAPEPKARTPTTEGKVVRLQRGPKPQPGLSAARHSTRPMIRKSLSALLIFASIVALIVAYRSLRSNTAGRHQIADIVQLRIWANNGQSSNALVVGSSLGKEQERSFEPALVWRHRSNKSPEP